MIFCFWSKAPVVGGFIERVVFNFIPDQNSKTPLPHQAWAWVSNQQHSYPFPPVQANVRYGFNILGPNTGDLENKVICIQPGIAQVSQQFVNSGQPTGEPTGNRGQNMTPPPQAGPRIAPGQTGPYRNPGMYEDLPGAALPGSQDPTFGDLDPEAGTFTDIDANTGQEMQREYVRQAPPPPQQRIG